MGSFVPTFVNASVCIDGLTLNRGVFIGPSQGRTRTSPLLCWCRIRSDAINCLDSSTLLLFLRRFCIAVMIFLFCTKTQASEVADLSKKSFSRVDVRSPATLNYSAPSLRRPGGSSDTSIPWAQNSTFTSLHVHSGRPVSLATYHCDIEMFSRMRLLSSRVCPS